MPAATGDLLGLQCVWMPSGFPVAVIPEPEPTPATDQHGDIGVRPSRKRAPTYHAVEVASLIQLVGAADVHVLAPLTAIGVLDVVGSAVSSAAYVIGDLVPSAQASLGVEASLAVAAIEATGEIRTEGGLWAQQYNERDVRLILGLPL